MCNFASKRGRKMCNKGFDLSKSFIHYCQTITHTIITNSSCTGKDDCLIQASLGLGKNNLFIGSNISKIGSKLQ